MNRFEEFVALAKIHRLTDGLVLVKSIDPAFNSLEHWVSIDGLQTTVVDDQLYLRTPITPENLEIFQKTNPVNNALGLAAMTLLFGETFSAARPETILLSKIIMQLLKENKYSYSFDTQHQVGSFRIDLLVTVDKQHTFGLEIDENAHADRDEKYEVMRASIIEMVGHRLIRIPIKTTPKPDHPTANEFAEACRRGCSDLYLAISTSQHKDFDLKLLQKDRILGDALLMKNSFFQFEDKTYCSELIVKELHFKESIEDTLTIDGQVYYPIEYLFKFYQNDRLVTTCIQILVNMHQTKNYEANEEAVNSLIKHEKAKEAKKNKETNFLYEKASVEIKSARDAKNLYWDQLIIRDRQYRIAAARAVELQTKIEIQAARINQLEVLLREQQLANVPWYKKCFR